METTEERRMSSVNLNIEEAATPELECLDTSESAIEDAFWMEDPDEILVTKLNIKEFMQNVQNYMQEKGELQDVDMSRALVALTQEAASIPMPKLKNASRLRIEYQVWTEESLTIHVHIFLQYGHEVKLHNPFNHLKLIAPPKGLVIYAARRHALHAIACERQMQRQSEARFCHASTPTTGEGSRGRDLKRRSSPNVSQKKVEGPPVGSKNKPKPPIYITRESDSNTQTTMIEIPPCSDVVKGVADFAFRRCSGIGIFSCNGAIANVSFISSASSHAHASTFMLNGRFEILSLSATFFTCPIPPLLSLPSSSGSPTKLPITITLAGSNGQMIGGKVAVALIVAGPVVVVAASIATYLYSVCRQRAKKPRIQILTLTVPMPAVAMMYGALAPNTMNRQLPSLKMPWLCSTIAMMLGVAINSDQNIKHKTREVDDFTQMGEVPRYKPKT